ncbi:M1 family metallopeptidase [Candidatus Saccharibacteria bacterium]|nr:M1 family metallopeptidase [Candidatus Saccharibacteria bacterium]
MERLLEYFTPEHYKITLNINKHTGKAFGTTIITGTPKSDTVKLHAKGLNIREITSGGDKLKYVLEQDMIVLTSGDLRRRRESRIGSAPVTTGRATGAPEAGTSCSIEIAYSFALNTNMQGCYLSSYDLDGEKEYLVSTQFESHYARECFPCIDEPAAKATFDLKIITPDTEDTIVSNMPAKSERILEYESVNPDLDPHNTEITLNTTVKKKIVEFETTPKMSTYLLAFCLGRFHKKSKTNKHGVKITSYCALNQNPDTLKFANEIAADSLDYYDDKFGIKYPLPKLDQVAIPDFEAGAMENWGLVTYRESCMLVSPDDSKTTKEYISTVIAHELSHQWFGNLVTMEWWNNLWLNESFANMMEYVCIDAIRPSYHIWEYFFTGECRAALMRDALPGVQAVQQEVNDPAEIATLFDGAIVYAKGAHLMFQLYRLMGEKAFFSGLKDYFKAHKYSNTTGDDLWNALQPYADFDIKGFMDAWISQPGFPVITDGHQQRFLLSGATDDTKWPLPRITDDMSGHYIINLSGEEFTEKIAKFDKLSEEQKIRLLIDRSMLSKTSLVSTATHFDLLPKFEKETNFAIWNPVLALISDLKLFFTPDDADFAKFQQFIASLTKYNLDRLGLIPHDGEDDNKTKLRQVITGLALYSGNKDVISELAEMYEDDAMKIHPELRSSVLLAKLRSDSTVFTTYLEKYQKVADPNLKDDYLSALTDDRRHIDELIKLLSEHDIVRPQDHLYLFVDLIRNHKTREKAMNWLYDNWSDVVEMTGEKSLEDYPRLLATAIRTTEEAKRFEEFFTPLAENPVLTRTISVAKADIDARLRLLSMDYADVHTHLLEIEQK